MGRIELTDMNKNEILKRFNASTLSEVKDDDLISLARRGELGERTRYSVEKTWAFPDQAVLAKHIRTAIEKNKELVVLITLDAPTKGSVEVGVEYM